jgi:peptide/nickel transport system permease protein
VHPILKLVVQRVALGLLLLLAVSAVIFLGVEALPGDTAQAILGQQATPEALANLREKMGLNEPPLTRYFSWLGGVLTGDLGTALTNGADIATSIGQRWGTRCSWPDARPSLPCRWRSSWAWSPRAMRASGRTS